MSILTDLFSTLDKRSLSGISEAAGVSEQSTARGMQTAIATVLGGMASKSDNPGFLRKMIDLAPSGGAFSWASLASGMTNPASPGMAAGKNILSSMFGGSESMISHVLGAGTGMQTGIISSMLAMCAPMVMGFLGKRVRDQGMNMDGLGNMLQREVPAIREVLPTGVSDLLWPRTTRETVVESPVVAQTVTRERSAAGWLVPLLLVAAIPGLIWLFSRTHRPTIEAQAPPPISSGTANRAIPEPVPETPKAIVPVSVDLYFDTGSARLRPESQARLNEFANTMAANSDARVTVSGYTDNVGNAESNLRLSQARADAVKSDLVAKGIAADRLTARGYGEDDPIADNATAEGRGRNRHVAVGMGEMKQ
jgi:OOP family OmpA-OmpF porin